MVHPFHNNFDLYILLPNSKFPTSSSPRCGDTFDTMPTEAIFVGFLLVHVDTFQITLFNFCCCCCCCCWVTSTFHINQDCGYLWPTSTFSFFALNISKRDHFFQKLSPPRPIWFHRLHKSQIKLGKSFIWKHEHSRSPRRHEQEKKRDLLLTDLLSVAPTFMPQSFMMDEDKALYGLGGERWTNYDCYCCTCPSEQPAAYHAHGVGKIGIDRMIVCYS